VLGDLEKMEFEIRSVRLPEPASAENVRPKTGVGYSGLRK
jgi:hypothetical protein